VLSKRTFALNGSRYRYFYHRYNNTCETERCVEIPITRALLEGCRSRDVLEIGNVLNHYEYFPHTVIDKYEIGDGVTNIDVQDFVAPQNYDAIVSISTMEHVGWDEEPLDSLKVLRCITRLQGMLNRDGKMLISFPVGHNATLDQAVVNANLGCDTLRGMKRGSFNNWVEFPISELMNQRLEPSYSQNYGKYRQTRAVVFAYFSARPKTL
jgi:hypothetical protein